MNDIELIKKLGVEYFNLDGEITAQTSEDFVEQWKNIFSSPLAKNHKALVYIWSTSLGIPRLRGESNIVYIGQTELSLYGRLHKYAKLEGSNTNLNWNRYKYIIKKYGPIKFKFAHVENHKEAENKLLELYYEEHLELTPINRVR